MRATLVSFLFLCFMLLPAASPAWAQSRLVLEAPEALKPALAPALQTLEAELDSTDPLERLASSRRARRAMEEALAAEGWFSPKIDIDLGAPAKVSVNPGARVLVGAVEIEFHGPLGEEAARVARLREGWLLKPGRVFRQAEWSAAKSALLREVLAHDFAAAKIHETLADIDPEHAQAFLKVVIDSGPAFTFGALQWQGLRRYAPHILARYNPIKPGERFSQSRLDELQATLQATPYFSSVVVDVARVETDPTEAPITVQVSEAKTRHVTASAGGSTNFGPRVELNYRDHHWLDRALGLGLGIEADRLRQAEFIETVLPLSSGGYRDSLGLLRESHDNQGLLTRRVALGAKREWVRPRRESALTLNAQQEQHSAEGTPSITRNALSLAASVTWRHVDNTLDPRQGWLLNAQVGGGSKLFLSDQNFLRGYLHAQKYWPVALRDVFTLRFELGLTAALDREGIPQDFLFRAGGAQSVRGYAYQSLGVREGQAIVGGRFMSVNSAEYTHWLDEKWGVAAFVDAGNVTDTREDFRYLYGAGLGARWKSPAGPLALDFATGERDRIRAHFAIMIAF